MIVDGVGELVIKGPDVRIVFAEAACYELANLVGLDVPPHGLCTVPGEPRPYFCSRKMGYRLPVDILVDGGQVINTDIFARTIVFDVWTANEDRNIGNFVQDRPPGAADDRLRLYAIDFEKAAALRGEPDQFTITSWPMQRFWPRGQLGELCRRYHIPADFCDVIAALDHKTIESILRGVQMDMDLADIFWLEAASRLLARRAARLHEFVQEAWHG